MPLMPVSVLTDIGAGINVVTMETINWNVKTQARAYSIGYQDAMKDIKDAMANGGIEAVEEWVKNKHCRGAIMRNLMLAFPLVPLVIALVCGDWVIAVVAAVIVTVSIVALNGNDNA